MSKSNTSGQKNGGWESISRSKCCVWLRKVFIERKEYVPGDTCRFIWQTDTEVKRSFLCYRSGHLLGAFCIFAISCFHIGETTKNSMACETVPTSICFGPFRFQFEWLFYATSWGIMFNLAQSIWGMVLTVQFYLRQKKQPAIKPSDRGSKPDIRSQPVSQQSISKGNDSSAKVPRKSNDSSAKVPVRVDPPPKEHKIPSRTGFYWGLHAYAISASVLIDVVYWTLIWPSARLKEGASLFHQMNEHGFNLPLMITDYCVVAFPVVITYISFTFSISFVYLLVSVIYFLCGGMNEDNSNRYLYSFINWEKPGIAIAYGSFMGLTTSLFFLILLLIDHFKFKCRPQKPLKKKGSSHRGASPNRQIP